MIELFSSCCSCLLSKLPKITCKIWGCVLRAECFGHATAITRSADGSRDPPSSADEAEYPTISLREMLQDLSIADDVEMPDAWNPVVCNKIASANLLWHRQGRRCGWVALPIKALRSRFDHTILCRLNFVFCKWQAVKILMKWRPTHVVSTTSKSCCQLIETRLLLLLRPILAAATIESSCKRTSWTPNSAGHLFSKLI